jgi:uncharacterized protein
MAGSSDQQRLFLAAEWRDLVMLNYEVDPRLLREHVPRGTEQDSFGGRTLVSLVGFRFLRSKLSGVLPVPFHANFDEVNLRFYVRRRDSGGEIRRGVVFIREIVPKRAVAWLARLAYGENYVRYPMRHRVSATGPGAAAEYEWRTGGAWMGLRAEAAGAPELPAEGSLEQFISEHYWGYSRQRDGGCVEYHVTHPQWRVWRGASGGFEGDGAALYGDAFGEVLRRAPDWASIADGSAVVVFQGRRIA